MTQPAIVSISPFFVVGSVRRSISFYCENLGFEVMFQEPAADEEPFFAIVSRDGGMIF